MELMDSSSSVVLGSGGGGKRKTVEEEELSFKVPDPGTFIPDLCYCGSCKRLFYSRKEIGEHLRVDHEGGKKRLLKKEEIPEPSKGCDLKEFLELFLTSTLFEEDEGPSYFSNTLFDSFCEENLKGAPKDCNIGDFVMWVLTEAWDENLTGKKDFLRKLRDGPSAEVDWDELWGYRPLTRFVKDHRPPTICVYK